MIRRALVLVLVVAATACVSTPPRPSEPTAQAIRNWVLQAERDEGRRDDGPTTAERDEINRLRRENRQLKLERDIANGLEKLFKEVEALK